MSNGKAKRPASKAVSHKRTLREHQWAALAALYAAGQAGIEGAKLMYSPGGFAWHRTLLGLVNYRPRPLIERQDRGGLIARSRFSITTFGIEYYAREWRYYRKLYPAVNAPKPQHS